MPEPSKEFSSGAVVPSIGIFQPANGPRDAVQAAISRQGWSCVTLPAPITGMRAWLEAQYDALLVAPFSGWEEPAHLIGLARAIAGARPLVVLTADASVDQRLVALHAGADDALWCDADPRELLARIGGLLRRQRLASGWLECAELCIDLIDRRVTRLGRAIALPLREFDLLTRLARVPDRIVAREALWRAVWKIDFDPGTNRIEVHMSRLRAKLDRGFDWPMLITARGHGYGLRSSSSAARQVGRA